MLKWLQVGNIKLSCFQGCLPPSSISSSFLFPLEPYSLNWWFLQKVRKNRTFLYNPVFYIFVLNGPMLYQWYISFICNTGWVVGSLKYEFGQGIWCGIIFCGCGSIGVATAISPSIHKIKLFILANTAAIISSFTLAFLGFSNIYKLRYQLANISLEGHPYSTNHENDDIRILLQLIVVQIVISIIVVSLILLSLMGIILISFARSKMDYYIQRKEVVWV